MTRTGLVFFLTTSVMALVLSSCSSARKERLEQREKIAGTSGLYCDFINGEKFNDVEVVLNLEMGKRCDSAKPFSISGFKSAAEVVGMMYCCSTTKKSEAAAPTNGKAGQPSQVSAATSGKPSPGAAVSPTPASSSGSTGKPTGVTNPAKDPLIDEVAPE
ncbi:MAG: hypothetical protein JNM39_00075 [Bdellovibrionaceae bacterium]|nr:hypothetical protein [Pseudobdellovibrionaceae bacterium]